MEFEIERNYTRKKEAFGWSRWHDHVRGEKMRLDTSISSMSTSSAQCSHHSLSRHICLHSSPHIQTRTKCNIARIEGLFRRHAVGPEGQNQLCHGMAI